MVLGARYKSSPATHIPSFIHRSEDKFQTQRHLPNTAPESFRIQKRAACLGLSVPSIRQRVCYPRSVEDISVGQGVTGMVENVKHFGSELQVFGFSEVCVFENRKIERRETGCPETVSANRSQRPTSSN